MSFEAVTTMEDLLTLDEGDIVAGYREFRRGDPEPGPNRGRAYWHGWKNASRDHHCEPPTPEAAQLAREFLAHQRPN